MQIQKKNKYNSITEKNNANTHKQIQCKYRKANKTHPTERPIQRDRAPPNIIPTVFATGGADSNKYEVQVQVQAQVQVGTGGAECNKYKQVKLQVQVQIHGRWRV